MFPKSYSQRIALGSARGLSMVAAVTLCADVFADANSFPDKGSADLPHGTAAAPPIGRVLPRLSNLSTRAMVGQGDNVIIGGFIIRGTEKKRVLARVIGPSLGSQGVASALQDPTLELVPSAGTSSSNDDWTSNAGEVTATGIPPSDSRESAIVKTLDPGSYTLVARGKNNSTGIAVVELYDLETESEPTLANISGRGMVGTDDNVMIAGLTVQGDPTSSDIPVVIRGIGPSLSSQGVAGALADPELLVFDANGTLIASNDSWKETQEEEIQLSGLAPSDDHEPAIKTTLPLGQYTAIVRGKNHTTGVALVEIYNTAQ